MEKNTIFKELNINDINSNLLDSFNRLQEVKRFYKKVDGNWIINDTNYTVDWTYWKKKELIADFVNALNSGGNVIGAFENEEMIGFAVLLKEETGKNEQIIELKYMYVSLKYRHKGIGKRLFKLCIEKAIEKGVEKIRILVDDPEETQRFFLGLGFTDVKEEKKKELEKNRNNREMEYEIKKV